MYLFQNIVALLLVALLLLAVSRKSEIPYPTILAIAGGGYAALPFAPLISIDPHLALVLFIAPALFHAAYATPPRELRRHGLSLFALAVVAVVLTTIAVAAVGVFWGGLPLAAAIALGAIVSPPDAVVWDAVTTDMDLPRRGILILQGETLLNDATALLIFGAAVALTTQTDAMVSILRLGLALPGGGILGLAVAWLYLRLIGLFAGALGASLIDFVVTFAIWLVAGWLKLSPVLAVVVFGMVVAWHRPVTQPARDRLQTTAVWAAAILVLNIVAFTLMGLQSREILLRLAPEARLLAIGFGLGILATVLLVRVVWVFVFRGLEGVVLHVFAPAWLPEPQSWREVIIIAWSGTRGLLTLATAFALPAHFPGRDLIVLAAFCVVLGTLLLQGLTLGPLIRRLGFGVDTKLSVEIADARTELLAAGLTAIADHSGPGPDALRVRYRSASDVLAQGYDPQTSSLFDQLQLDMIERQRSRLHGMRQAEKIPEDVYRRLQEELDWAEVDARSFSDNILRPV